MKLEWSAYALTDRDRIFDYIEADSPLAAVRVDEAIRDQVHQLLVFPESGRPGRIPETRELVIVSLPYVVIYRRAADIIRILRVLHCAQQWPDTLGQ